MSKSLTVDELIEYLWRLPARDRWHVVGQVVARAERESESPGAQQTQSQWGAWSNLGPAPSEEDIQEVRREMWANFPRDDIA
jgi:hypothetical protein